MCTEERGRQEDEGGWRNKGMSRERGEWRKVYWKEEEASGVDGEEEERMEEEEGVRKQRGRPGNARKVKEKEGKRED